MNAFRADSASTRLVSLTTRQATDDHFKLCTRGRGSYEVGAAHVCYVEISDSQGWRLETYRTARADQGQARAVGSV